MREKIDEQEFVKVLPKSESKDKKKKKKKNSINPTTKKVNLGSRFLGRGFARGKKPPNG